LLLCKQVIQHTVEIIIYGWVFFNKSVVIAEVHGCTDLLMLIFRLQEGIVIPQLVEITVKKTNNVQ